jgi:hypothetical protein
MPQLRCTLSLSLWVLLYEDSGANHGPRLRAADLGYQQGATAPHPEARWLGGISPTRNVPQGVPQGLRRPFDSLVR